MRNWSQQQQAIFSWFKEPSAARNLVVRARAGTGKTTTIVEAITHAPESRIMLAAFNKKIADELKAKLTNPNAEAKTLHSLGYAFLQRYWPNTRPDSHRAYELAKKAAGGDIAPDEMISLISKLASKGKALLPKDAAALLEAAVAFDLLPDEEWVKDGWTHSRIVSCAMEAMSLAASTRDGTCDFDDMIYVPVRNGWVRPRFDLVVIDEAQDMNASQLQLARSACEPTGRICVVGDDRQAIYAFRGADSGSLDRLKTELSATELGLTVTYRCGTNIVAEAKALVPDYSASPTAHKGEIIGTRQAPTVTLDSIPEKASPGDFVLSRKNAPLAKVCLRLLRAGKRAKVEGRDIGANFKAIVRKMKAKSIPDFLSRLVKWEEKQKARAKASARTEEQAAQKVGEVQDQAETLRVLAEGMAGITELTARIDDLFTDNVGGQFVVCSSVHRSKGRETDRVFVLAETLYPKKGNAVEEANIHYVAVTRAKNTLVWVSGS